MIKQARERFVPTMSLNSQEVHGYRDIIDLILEKYDDLSSVEEKHLEPHEREALEMFREFEKKGDYRKSGRRLPVLG